MQEPSAEPPTAAQDSAPRPRPRARQASATPAGNGVGSSRWKEKYRFLLKRETGAAGGRHATGFCGTPGQTTGKLSAPAGFQSSPARFRLRKSTRSGLSEPLKYVYSEVRVRCRRRPPLSLRRRNLILARGQCGRGKPSRPRLATRMRLLPFASSPCLLR